MKTDIMSHLNHLKGSTNTLPVLPEVEDQEAKFLPKTSIPVLGIKVWNTEKLAYVNNTSPIATQEVPSSPFFLANKELKAVYLDGSTTSLLRSYKFEEISEGLLRLEVAFAELRAKGWFLAPMKHLKTIDMNGERLGLLIVSKTKSINVPDDKLVKSGNYVSVKGMKDVPVVDAKFLRIPAQNDGKCFISERYATQLWPKLARRTDLLKIAGNPTNFEDAFVHNKGTVGILRRKESVALYFSRNYLETNKTELEAIGLDSVDKIWSKLNEGYILTSDNELKMSVPAMGESIILSVVVHDYAGYTQKSMVNICLQMLLRMNPEDPEILNATLVKHAKIWKDKITTLKGIISLIDEAIADADEDFEGEAINRKEMAAATTMLRMFPLAVDPKGLTNALVRSYPAVIRRLTRILVPGTSMYPDYLDCLKKGEIGMSPKTAKDLGKRIMMHSDEMDNITGMPFCDGEKVYTHRYPSLLRSLKDVTIRIIPHMHNGVIAVSKEDAADQALDWDGDKLQIMKRFAGNLCNTPAYTGTSSFMREMSSFTSNDVVAQDMVNANFSKNIGIADTMLNQVLLAKGVHHPETLAFADQVLQKTITSVKHAGDNVIDLEEVQRAIWKAQLPKLPHVFWWLRAKPTDEPTADILKVAPNTFAVTDTFPTHMKGLIATLNEGVTPWFETFDYAADSARWMTMQDNAKKVVLSNLYKGMFGDDVGPEADAHRFFLDDSKKFGPRLKTYELRVLNWAYVMASSGGTDDPMRSFDFDVVRAFARNIVEDRTNLAISRGISTDNAEEFKAISIACLLCRFWSVGFFNRSIVDAFTTREIWVALKAMESIANGLPSGGPAA